MTMEKYGCDLDLLPPTEEQLEKLASLGIQASKMPLTRKDAERLILAELKND